MISFERPLKHRCTGITGTQPALGSLRIGRLYIFRDIATKSIKYKWYGKNRWRLHKYLFKGFVHISIPLPWPMLCNCDVNL